MMLLMMMLLMLLLIHHWLALGPVVVLVSIRRAALILGLGMIGLSSRRSRRISAVAVLDEAVTAKPTTIGIGIRAVPLHLVLTINCTTCECASDQWG